MKIHFARDNSWQSRLIRLATFSPWHHVGIEVGGMVYEATMKHGVVITAPNVFMARYPVVETVTIKADSMQAVRFLNRQVGKPYDWGAVFGWPLRKDWHDPGAWFCSELAAAVLDLPGLGELHRVMPGKLWRALNAYLQR